MPLGLLNAWVRAYGLARGLSVRSMDGAPGALLDAGVASLLAIEWAADAHSLHVYGHPGRMPCSRAPQAPSQPELDDEEDQDGAWGVTCDAPIDLSADDTERRSLHLDSDTGLVTLSLVVPFTALSAAAFEAWIDSFIGDMAMWATVFADDLSSADAPSGTAGREAPGHIPWGAITG